jgi:plastocyanin
MTGSSPRRRRSTATLRALAVAPVVAILVAGCSGGDTALPEADIVMIGTDRLTWEPDRLTVQPGTLSVAIVCEGGANHNFVIDETGEEVAACAPGRTAFGEVTLEPGNYTVVCTVPGHEATMRAALAVAVR